MCGIVGRWNHRDKELAPGLLARMTRTLRHRGPDDQGMVLFRREPGSGWRADFHPRLHGRAGGRAIGGFGHTRLSVIDLSPAGRQPMRNEDGSLWITYNGEIYNFESLRDELAARGHRFRSRTDTEVILHAYEEWGTACLDRFNGMFAFGLFDSRRDRLFLARDRLGVKPLYYHAGEGCFAFASEPKALFQCADIPRVLSPEAVHDYLVLGYCPSPRTFFRHLRKLPPGHHLLLALGAGAAGAEPRVTPYWDARFEPDRHEGEEEEYARELRRLLSNSVRLRLLSDVPLGAFLSGGVDSSTIVALMRQFTRERVKTFSIGFPEPGFDETPFAREAASHLGTEHHDQILSPGLHRELGRVLRFYDEPLADTSILPTCRVSALAREQVTVCLSGDGGDELFGGYHQHGLAAGHPLAFRVPPALRWPLAWMRARGLAGQGRIRAGFRPLAGLTPAECVGLVGSWSGELAREILRPSFLESLDGHSPYEALDSHYLRSRRASPLDRIQYVDLKTYLPEDILTKVDRASMAVGLEVRVPFLDYRLVEFAARLPDRFRVRSGRQKVLLKSAFSDLLPRSVVERSKQGFAIPEAPWLLAGPLAGRIRRLSDPGSYVSRFVPPEKVEGLLGTFKRLYPHPGRLIWALLILEEWFRGMERYGGVDIPAA